MLGSRGVSVNEIGPVCLAHRVTHYTLCPLGKPEIAIGHEPRIEPWLPLTHQICLPLSRTRAHLSPAAEKLTSMDNKPNFSRELNPKVGWISRKNLASGRGGGFFLTSLFIELIDPGRRSFESNFRKLIRRAGIQA